ncbi:type II toxin-antitoxin system HipA family toxin [Pontibacterium sp.]|uniref:type II toxin-antitoxin system HipA family toxin n=1 Tax=Pontibacterium sp. TaxID=2036026 RepID=UPI003567F338
MKDSAAIKLYGNNKVNARLNITRQELFAQGAKFTQGMSISGVQQKLSLKLDPTTNTLIPTDKDGEYILKPTPDGLPYCAEMEHLSMEISRALKIETALCGLVEFSDGERAYITRRFDRTLSGKLHQEDPCSLSDKLKDDKYNSTYETAGRILAEATGGKVAVLDDYFKRVLLAYLIGNDDLHLKNISVMRLPDNKDRVYDKLTPHYDNLCTEFYETGMMNHLAMPLLDADDDASQGFSEAYQHFGFYTRADFMTLAENIGLPAKAADNSIKAIAKAMQKIKDLIENAYIPGEYKPKYTGLVKQRYKAICAEHISV